MRNPNIPEVKPGDPIKATTTNQIIRRANLTNLPADSFNSKNFRVTRKTPSQGGGDGSVYIPTKFAVVTEATLTAAWTGSGTSGDFAIEHDSGLGKAVLLNQVAAAGTGATSWAASTAYDADEPFSLTVPALTDPVDNDGNPLQVGAVYDMAYPTSQTSGSSIDLAELAKMVIVRWIPGASDIGKLAMPILAEGQAMSEFEMILHNLYEDESQYLPLSVNRVITVSNLNGGVIPYGPYSGNPPHVFGEYLRPTDYLRELDGLATNKVFWSPDGSKLEFKGKTCSAS